MLQMYDRAQTAVIAHGSQVWQSKDEYMVGAGILVCCQVCALQLAVVLLVVLRHCRLWAAGKQRRWA